MTRITITTMMMTGTTMTIVEIPLISHLQPGAPIPSPPQSPNTKQLVESPHFIARPPPQPPEQNINNIDPPDPNINNKMINKIDSPNTPNIHYCKSNHNKCIHINIPQTHNNSLYLSRTHIQHSTPHINSDSTYSSSLQSSSSTTQSF